MTEGLRPCPFCGGPAKREDITEDDGFCNIGGSYIGCASCGACTAVVFGRKETLLDRWNIRARDNNHD